MGKINYCLGNLDPNWAKCLRSGQNFSRNEKKKKFMERWEHWEEGDRDTWGEGKGEGREGL